jgi:hypothetical protein
LRRAVPLLDMRPTMHSRPLRNHFPLLRNGSPLFRTFARPYCYEGPRSPRSFTRTMRQSRFAMRPGSIGKNYSDGLDHACLRLRGALFTRFLVDVSLRQEAKRLPAELLRQPLLWFWRDPFDSQNQGPHGPFPPVGFNGLHNRKLYAAIFHVLNTLHRSVGSGYFWKFLFC